MSEEVAQRNRRRKGESPDDASRFDPIRRSPAHYSSAALGAEFVSEAAWELPSSYGSVAGERRAIREDLALADVSARGKVDVKGAIGTLLDTFVSGAPLGVGQTRIAGEGDGQAFVAARLSDGRALVLCEPAVTDSVAEALVAAAPAAAMVTDVTCLYAGFAVLGPLANELLARLTDFDPERLAPRTCAATRLAETNAQLIRPGYPPDAIEVCVGWEDGPFVWETLLSAGAGLGARPVGWEALRAEGWW